MARRTAPRRGTATIATRRWRGWAADGVRHTHGYNPALTADGAATGNHTAESSIMNETILYHRNREYIPRIAAVHDMCGYGK